MEVLLKFWLKLQFVKAGQKPPPYTLVSFFFSLEVSQGSCLCHKKREASFKQRNALFKMAHMGIKRDRN